MKNKYVYIYRDPQTDEPFWIGIGENQRAWGFTMPSVIEQCMDRAPDISKHMKAMLARGEMPVIQFLKTGISKDEAKQIRAGVLAQYGLKSDGGWFLNSMKCVHGWDGVARMLREFDIIEAKRDRDRKHHCVYMVRDPETREPVYVGSGTPDRPYHHLRPCYWLKPKNDSFKEFYSWFGHFMRNGVQPIIEVLKEGLTKNESLYFERTLINQYGKRSVGGSLFNKQTY